MIEINGGPQAFDCREDYYREMPDPVCADDGMVIEVEAISIEGGDLLARTTTPSIPTACARSTRRACRSRSARRSSHVRLRHDIGRRRKCATAKTTSSSGSTRQSTENLKPSAFYAYTKGRHAFGRVVMTTD